MKILLTNTGPWGTGSFTVARGILDEFIRLGHEVRLFFPDTMLPTDELSYYLKHSDIYKMWKFPHTANGKTLTSFPLIIPDPHPRSTAGKTLAEYSDEDFNFYKEELTKQLKVAIDDFQPDVIECQHIWICDHIIDQFGYPFLSTAHHSDQMGFLYDKRMQPIAADSAKKARYIFAVSSHVKREVCDLYGVSPEKIIVSGNGYNQTVFQPRTLDREQILKEFDLSIPPDAKICTFAGKMSRTKGIDILLMANKLLTPEDNIHFILMGAGHLLEALNPEKPDAYSMERIHVVGHQNQENLSKLHNIGDFSTMPSRSEGFGIAILEAMGCGLPAIVTRCGGPEDFAVGEVIEKENPNALAQAIKKMAALSPKEYHTLSLQAFEKAKNYSWRAIAEERIKFYINSLEIPQAS